MKQTFPRRLAACFTILLAAVLVSAPGEAPAPIATFDATQKAALDRISTYLNGIHLLKSGFIQLGPEGQLDQGEFLLEKPGKLRFEYNAPNPTLIVATGGKMYVKNGRLNTVDRYDISDTPLGLLLSDNVDLKTNQAVTGIDIRPDALVVHTRTFNNRQQQGVITMVFSNPEIDLRQWTVKDNQGGTTMVALRNPELKPGPVDETLFDMPVKDPPPESFALMGRPVVGIVCDLESHRDGSRSHRAGDEYVRAIREGVGAEPLLIPASDPPPDAALLQRLDGLLFPGALSNVAASRYGGAPLAPGTLLDEARDATTLKLLAAAIADGLPVFCICRGFQELNVALGGSLNPEVSGETLDHRENRSLGLAEQYRPAHRVTIAPGGVLSTLLGADEVTVNSLHAQGIARLAPGLFVEARAPDGLVEAVSLPSSPFVLGVQWHPEWHAAADPVSSALFSAFGRALESSRQDYGKNGPDKRKMI